MLPITLGLGLINFNAFIDTIFAARLARQVPGAELDQRGVPPVHLPAGDVLRSGRDRALPVARAARYPRGLRRLPRDGRASGCARSRSCSIPASVVCAVLAEPIVRIVYQRGDFTPVADQRRRRLPRRVLARARVQRRDADAEPRLLLHAGGVDPDLGRAREPRAERGARRGVLQARDLGIPLATSVVNIAGTIALLVLLRRKLGSLDGRRTTETVLRITAASAVLAGVCYGVWRPLDDALGHRFIAQVVSLGVGARARRRRLPARLPGCSACASSRRSFHCAVTARSEMLGSPSKGVANAHRNDGRDPRHERRHLPAGHGQHELGPGRRSQGLHRRLRLREAGRPLRVRHLGERRGLAALRRGQAWRRDRRRDRRR